MTEATAVQLNFCIGLNRKIARERLKTHKKYCTLILPQTLTTNITGYQQKKKKKRTTLTHEHVPQSRTTCVRLCLYFEQYIYTLIKEDNIRDLLFATKYYENKVKKLRE